MKHGQNDVNFHVALCALLLQTVLAKTQFSAHTASCAPAYYQPCNIRPMGTHQGAFARFTSPQHARCV